MSSGCRYKLSNDARHSMIFFGRICLHAAPANQSRQSPVVTLLVVLQNAKTTSYACSTHSDTCEIYETLNPEIINPTHTGAEQQTIPACVTGVCRHCSHANPAATHLSQTTQVRLYLALNLGFAGSRRRFFLYLIFFKVLLILIRLRDRLR